MKVAPGVLVRRAGPFMLHVWDGPMGRRSRIVGHMRSGQCYLLVAADELHALVLVEGVPGWCCVERLVAADAEPKREDP